MSNPKTTTLSSMMSDASWLSARSQAAIALKVPLSGIDDLDASISASVYRDVAIAALTAIISKHAPLTDGDIEKSGLVDAAVRGALDYADSFMDHLSGEGEAQ